MKFKRILFIFLITCLQLSAQQSGGVFNTERLGAKDGLSNRWTMCTLQDRRGYIWVGTYDGLNRYDGNDFIIYRASAKGKFPVTSDLVVQISETANGLILLSTGYGILSFDPKTEVFELLIKKTNDQSALVLNTSMNTVMEVNTELWANPGTSFTVYNFLPTGKLQALTGQLPAPSKYYSPIQSDREQIWFWDAQGSYHRLSLKEQIWTHHEVPSSKNVPVDAKGNLWLPEGPTLRSVVLPQNRRNIVWNSFNVEPGKAVWLYTTDEHADVRLMRYALATGIFKTIIPALKEEELFEYGIAQPYYSRQCMDQEGTVWLTGFQGLTKVRHTDNLFQHFLSKPLIRPESPSLGLSVRQMAEDEQGNIFILDVQQNLYKIDPASGGVERINIPPIQPQNDEINRYRYEWATTLAKGDVGNKVQSIFSDADGAVWFCTHLGIYRYDSMKRQFRQFYFPTTSIPTIYPNGKDSLWLLTSQECYSMDKSTGAFQLLKGLTYDQPYYGTMVPEEKTLWEFNDTGLVKINTQTLHIKKIRLYDEPREQRCIVSHNGWLWVGSSRGLEKVNPTTFAHTNFDRSKGLPGNFVYCMVADGDYLWLGTSDGLCRFHTETGAVKNFYVEDGLSHNEFNTPSALKAKNGRIYMGGLNGINAFYPADLEQKTNVDIHALLSKYSIFDTEQDSLIFHNTSVIPEVIVLPASVTSLNLYLALTSFLDPTKNQYAWRIDELDENWYYAGYQHVASYQHLSPGTYTFRAKAADPFGNWSKNEITLRIIVMRPWYSQWWAWSFYLMVASSLVYTIYRNQSKKRLERAERLRLQELDEFRSRFFTNITHEFRTPLTVILGMAEQIEAQNGKEVKGKIGLIRRNGQNLLRLINQILDLAKLESNALKLNYVQGEILPYLRYITESLHSYANAQNVMVRVESKESSIVMDYDPERMLQIVYNLVSNAIKFTTSGGRVDLRVKIDHTGWVAQTSSISNRAPSMILQVIDNGAGIPAEDLPFIFDRFYQANNLAKAKAGGTGIGLALSKELVKAMGGEISVESQVGKGTIFTVRLPIVQATNTPKAKEFLYHADGLKIDEAVQAGSDTVFEDLNQAVTQQFENSTIPKLLLIEDNPDVVEYIASCLEGKYQLDFAYNGRSGIDKAIDHIPDIIISDVMMPEKDGFEVCETLKKDQRTSHIPIILLTARADAASRITGLRRGADAYLSKPFHPEELLVQLQMLTEKQQRIAAWLFEKAKNEKVDVLPESSDNEDIQIEDAFIQKLRTIVSENYADEGFGLTQLCQKIGMSRSQLFRKMTALIATSPSDFIRSYRLNEAQKLLKSTNLNVSEVAWKCGFVNLAHFSKVYQDEFGIAPSATNK